MLALRSCSTLRAQSSQPWLPSPPGARRPRSGTRLEELVDQSEQVIERPDEFNQLALAFHSAIAEASRNRVLQATLASLGEVLSIHYRDRGSPESARAAVQGHRRLLAVLRSGDAEAAREEMQGHLIAVRGQLQIG
jgi:DNA-binding FadR family transcriptional regulator